MFEKWVAPCRASLYDIGVSPQPEGQPPGAEG